MKKLLVLAVLVAALVGESAGRVTAQTFRTLATNVAPVIVSGNTIYGFSSSGIVAINTDGTGLRTLYAFTPLSSDTGWTNSDGGDPWGLTLSGSTMYGSCRLGGGSGGGTLFSLNTDGTGFATLYNFSQVGQGNINADGAQPRCQLVMSGATLFGTTFYGGSGGLGTVFAFDLAGGGLTTLYQFSPLSSNGTNSDGAEPAGLVLATNGYTLYGTTGLGGPGGRGTVFAINTDGTGFATLYSFGSNSVGAVTDPNSDGSAPEAGVILSGQTLYGTTDAGGASGSGTVFKVNTDGSAFATLHNFTAARYYQGALTNSDGAQSQAALVLAGNTLYGTAAFGGPSGLGTVFAVNTDGSGFTVLQSSGGFSGPVVSGNNLYVERSGTLFSIALPIAWPQLSIVPAGANVILSWPTNVTGFTLQTTTDLASSSWTTNLASPVLVNGQNTVTNPITGTQLFYRLAQ